MPPSYRKVKVDFGKELVQKSCQGDEKKSLCEGRHVESNQDVLQRAVLVTQAWGQHQDEGEDAATNAAPREVDIEDVEQTDMGVLTAGDEEPEIEPEAENNNRQQTDCQHQEEDVTRIRTWNEKLRSIWVPK